MLTKVIEYLRNKNWLFVQRDEMPNVLFFTLKGLNGSYQCIFDVRPEINLLLFISYSPINCPPEKANTLLLFLNKLNLYLTFGNYEMFEGDYQVKFRTSMLTEGFDLTEKMIDNLLFKNVSSLDGSMPFISQIMFGETTPDEAYNRFLPPILPQAEISN